MRFPLRWRILLFTVLPIVTVVVATLWMVNRRVSDRVRAGIEDDLRRSSAVFENMLDSRTRELVSHGQVIAQDPRFFSVLTLPGGPDDAQVRATVSGVARDFNTITGADLFEVIDREGRLVASVGRASLDPNVRRPLIPPALAGRPIADIVVQGEAHYQVTLTPVIAGGRLLGVLVLGLRIGEELADRLRAFTRSEVTFRSAQGLTVSTLESPADRAALETSIETLTNARRLAPRAGTVLEVRTANDVYLTLWRALPQTQTEGRQSYVMQRSLRAETAFLREIQSGLIELGVVAVVVAMIAGFLISERILAPVRRIVEGAEEMERGNYDFPLQVASRDEIGYLAERFDEMRRQQRAYVSSLEEATRVKTEFINIASHELRTPISIIRGFQELMSQGSLGPVHPRQAEALRAISRSTDTLARIAEDATRMAQIEGSRLKLDLGEHAVEPLLQEVVETTLRAGHDRRVTITVDVERGVTSWGFDRARLGVALGHLVSNGVRFTPDGGRVSVSARRENGQLAIAVSDTGIGLPSSQQVLGLDRSAMLRSSLQHHSSSTLEFNSRGLGLGLSIVRGIVDAHGGSVSAESEPGRGTTFTLRIPDRAEAHERAA